MNDIKVSAVVLRDSQGRILTVRKRGTHRFMLPGGKPLADESPAETAVREVREEIGAEIDPTLLRFLGERQAPAANEPNTLVHATIFVHPAAVVPRPAAEIEQIRWLDPHQELPPDLAPLLARQVLPLLT
ncbi:MAG: NUDIX hydrolase [Beutenbergiaceae bacterium]